jgi:hypothetical protein
MARRPVSSAVERLPYKQDVAGSKPAPGIFSIQTGFERWASGGLDSPWIVSSAEIRQNPCGSARACQDFTQISPAGEMAKDRPQWLADLSRGFKRHRQGRTG